MDVEASPVYGSSALIYFKCSTTCSTVRVLCLPYCACVACIAVASSSIHLRPMRGHCKACHVAWWGHRHQCMGLICGLAAAGFVCWHCNVCLAGWPTSVASKIWSTCHGGPPVGLAGGPLAQWCSCGTPRPKRAANHPAPLSQC